MDERTQRQIAKNEAILRDVNERNTRALGTFSPETDALTIMCECAHVECESMLDVSAGAYARVRSEPTHFLVAVDHAHPGVEVVIEDAGSHWVVAKIDVGADVARQAR